MASQGKRVDRRIIRSRKAIVEAFERLLVDRDLEKITVSAIAREANIDRKTFYVHFGTIDGLMDAVAEDIVNDIVDEVQAALHGKSAKEEPETALRAFFTTLNEVVCSNLVVNRRFVESTHTEALLKRIRSAFKRIIVDRALFPVTVPEDLFDYYLTFLFGGIISVYRHWMVADEDTDIERVSDVARRLTMGGLSGVETGEQPA